MAIKIKQYPELPNFSKLPAQGIPFNDCLSFKLFTPEKMNGSNAGNGLRIFKMILTENQLNQMIASPKCIIAFHFTTSLPAFLTSSHILCIYRGLL